MLDLSPALRLSTVLHAQAVALSRDHPRAAPREPAPHPEPETFAMTDLTLRPWRPADLEPCMEIWRAASEIGHPFLTRAELDADADLVRTIYMPSTDITVAVIDSEVVGFIALSGDFIGALFVSPAFHRRGIGARLLAHVARLHPGLEVEVYVANTAARRFYAASGFAEVLCHLTDDQGRPHALIQMQCRTPLAEDASLPMRLKPQLQDGDNQSDM